MSAMMSHLFENKTEKCTFNMLCGSTVMFMYFTAEESVDDGPAGLI